MLQDTTLDIYMRYRRELVSYASGIVGDPGRAEDVVQEAYLKFRAAAGGTAIEDPVGYLYRIVRNLAFDGRRRLVLERRYFGDYGGQALEQVAEQRPSPEAELIGRQQVERLRAAMAELPERTRIALEMHRLGGCKLREIAERLGISESMAHVLVKDGIKFCQRRM